ncbi:chloramphenicol-sensitive protein RarD [Limimonas halophila]|uniref:Chloramphenicol-sensitive protein RarD n=1 Tax=Limimonas halophila TaxID=1082479 RepID=A0A1G7L5Q4_9PROT|nr:EamA family transporter RarD [Limimonas halophila]SDF44847.1 chloramphenicol-sensitive protein RarD [Limimonas halophila]
MTRDDQRLQGGALTLSAFIAWGLLPLYFKAVSTVPALQLLAHRALWAAVLLLVIVSVLGRWRAIRDTLATRRTRWMLVASTLLIATNWLTFIYATQVGRVIEISLGYYINPLVNILLGVLVLRERLNAFQGAAVALAVAGVTNLAVQTAGLPWPSLVVAGSFGLYGLIRKTTQLASLDGLFLETGLMAPIAAAYLAYTEVQGTGALFNGDAMLDVLLLMAGVVTAVPLLLFASGARRITYTAVGFFQYLAPTGHFLLAVFVFGEPFQPEVQGVTFACIWTALAIFSADTLRRYRQVPAAAR